MFDVTLKPNSKSIEVIKIIEESKKRMAVVLSVKKKVIGTITDGDIRRHLLIKKNLNFVAKDIMQKNPITLHYKSEKKIILYNLKKYNIRAIPLVDRNGILKKIIHEDDLQNNTINKSFDITFKYAFIFAGGEGKRLFPITKNTPKPMIDLNGVPLIESQIRKLSLLNIKNIFISVNYKADVIIRYLGDGKKYGVKIKYVREKNKLGTAGPLSNLPQSILKSKDPLLVINGDVYTNHNFGYLYEFHKNQKSNFTICASQYKVDIPFGVIKNKDMNLLTLEEKPSEDFLCNAGIYAINPKIINIIPKNQFLNMNEFIDICKNKKYKITVFPLHEYWKEIGNKNDLSKVRKYLKDEKKII